MHTIYIDIQKWEKDFSVYYEKVRVSDIVKL
jgi:hypothetical protein